MPLGFAKSILTTAGAVGGNAARAFNDGQAINAANKASYNIPVNGGFANNHRFSFVAWVRINGTSQIDSPGVRAMRFINSGDSGGGSWSIFSNSFNINFFNGTQNPAPTTDGCGNTKYNTTNFASNFLDGSWHCVMFAMDPTDNTNRPLYIDGEDVQPATIHSGSNFTSDGDMDGIQNINLGYQGSSGTSTSYNAAWERGAEFDFGPIWFYDTHIDFSSSSVRAKYYNSALTDGYVDGGTDGTAGGAAQPELYLYHSATTLVNGGSLSSVTPSKVTKGSGDVVVVPTTEGPGSGDSY